MKCLTAVVFSFLAGALYSAEALTPNPCPPGTTQALCLSDPCSTVRCGNGTTCVSTSCGGCNAKCEPDSSCPKDKPPVYCFVNPCDFEQCPAETKCVFDNCGGCHARCEPRCGPVCLIFCEFGNVLDNNGCPTCQCKPDPCENVTCLPNQVCRPKDGQCVGTGCEYFTRQYSVGDSFSDLFSCNTCSCEAPDTIVCTEQFCPRCFFNEQSYLPGDKFPSTDGCNTCTCINDASVTCSQMPCAPEPCTYYGKTYKSGKSFAAADGCNTCLCTDGKVGCTKKACVSPGCVSCPYDPCIAALCVAGTTCRSDMCECSAICKPVKKPKTCTYNGRKYKSGESFPSTDGCNTCTCRNGAVGCTEKTCACPPVLCTQYCEHGFQTDVNGCEICQCKLDPCATVKCGSGTVCKNGQCVACPQVLCKLYCEHGFQTDVNGCEICQCKLDPCATVKCGSGTVCKNGQCVACPQVLCTQYCEHGFQTDVNGCEICQCKLDPCATVLCGSGTVCKNGQCVESPGCVSCPYDPCIAALCAAGTTCKSDMCQCSARCDPVESTSTGTCTYDGQTYQTGESFPAADGCNTCRCTEGDVSCTEMTCGSSVCRPCEYNPCIAALCPAGTTCKPHYCECTAICEPVNNPAACTYNGRKYKSGESFPSTDGCNTCTCSGTRAICSKRPCFNTCNVNGKIYQRGASYTAADGCNSCTCWGYGYSFCTRKSCCPRVKCAYCKTGYTVDKWGCQTCQCKDPPCERVTCKDNYSCSRGICWPTCSDPCLRVRCPGFTRCKQYPNCQAKCVPWYQWLPWF